MTAIPLTIDVIDDRFIEALIKESADAELALIDIGRLRLRRTISAALDMYLRQTVSDLFTGDHERDNGVRPADSKG